MSWKISAHQKRLNFVSNAILPRVNFRELCRQFTISAPTDYKWYNSLRPLEALAGRVPAALYAGSPRRFHIALAPSYPDTWRARSVPPNGWIKWQGTLRFIGRAFARQRIGLEPAEGQSWNIHMGALLIGTLHQEDGSGSMRAAMYRKSKYPNKKQKLKPSADSNV